MIFNQPFHRTLYNSPNLYAKRACGLLKHIAIVIGNRADKRHGHRLVAFVVLDIAHEERLESVEHQTVYGRFLDVFNQR